MDPPSTTTNSNFHHISPESIPSSSVSSSISQAKIEHHLYVLENAANQILSSIDELSVDNSTANNMRSYSFLAPRPRKTMRAHRAPGESGNKIKGLIHFANDKFNLVVNMMLGI